MATRGKKTECPDDGLDPAAPAGDAAFSPGVPEPPGPPEAPGPPWPRARAKKGPETSAAGNGGFCVYLGPSILGVIGSGTVYNSDKAATLDGLAPAVGKYPLIASLIVPGAELPKSRIDVKQAGSLLHANYSRLAGIIKNK